MASADTALQTVIFSRIVAQLAADGLSSAEVTAHPAPNRALPYVRIGEVPTAADSPAGQEFEANIDVFSRKDGPHEVKAIQASIRSALHQQDIEADGFHFTDMRIGYTSVFLDPTADVWQGVQRIRTLASGV